MGWTILLPLALVALGCWLFFPPFEHVIGGKDPGVYVSEGIQMAQRGSILVQDPVVSSVPPALRELFFPFSHNSEFYAGRFMGFNVLDPDQGTVVGQFFHFFPAWIAVAYGLDGVRGALATTPVAAILGLLAVYFAGARLLGRWASLAAATLLALNVVTLWFAREPNSEIVSQWLIFAALLALARSHVDGDRFFAPVAGVLLGLLLFLRLDGPVAIAAIAVALVLQLFERRRPSLMLVAPVAVLGAVAYLYWTTWMRAYVMMPRLAATGVDGVKTSALALAVCGGVLGVGAIEVVSRIPALAARVRWLVPRLLIAVIVLAAGYAYFFRVESHKPGGIAWCDARSLETFTWYFPPLALVAALAGFAVVAWRSFWRAPALIVTIALYCFFVFYKVRVVPDHFWMARRFVPVILPGACLMAAAGLSLLVSRGRREATASGRPRRGAARWAGLTVAVVLFTAIGVQLVRADRPIHDHVEYAGVLPRLEALAARFGPDDLVVFNPRDPSTDVHVLALPLNYIWNRPAVVLLSPKPDKAMFAQFLEWASHRYRNVYFLGGGGTDLVSRSIAAVPVFSDRFQVPEFESARNAYPRDVKRKEFDFGVYRFTRPGEAAATFELDIGRLDDLNVYRFHAKERSEATTFRWTRNASYIAVPPLEQAHTLTLWMNDGGRPATAEAARVTVFWNDRELGTVEVKGGGFRPYTLSIVPGVAPAVAGSNDSATVKLVSTTWRPRDVLGTADARELGVMLRRIEVK